MPQPKSRLGKAVEEKGQSSSSKIDAPTKPWTGPNGDGPNGGVSQSMLGRFMVCPRRFGVRVYEGLGAKEKFEPNIEYGNYWHVAEEAYKTDPDKPSKWLSAIIDYYKTLCNKYPMDREAITHWYGLCREQFPIYIEYWEGEGSEKNRVRLLSEQNFDVPYQLPSGKKVRLRGKWDGVSLIEQEYTNTSVPKKVRKDLKTKGVWLDENKTKSQVDHKKITTQLKFDLQTMFYLITLDVYRKEQIDQPNTDFWRENQHLNPKDTDSPIMGVRYNVVRRSAHKSSDSMVKKIKEDLEARRAGEWFGRWNVEISQEDVARFKKDFLDPSLERLCIWWDLISTPDALVAVNAFTLRDMMNWTMPYGVYSPLTAGGEDAVDEYLRSGSHVGLQRITNLFPELQEKAT